MLQPLINTIVYVLLTLINIYWWVVIVAVVMSWLITGGVINIHNNFARSVVQTLDALTEPVFRWVRRFLPPIAGLDLSPLIVLIALQAISMLIVGYARYLY